MQSNIRIDKDVSDRHSGRIFSILIVLFQISVSIIYGLFIESPTQLINVISIILCILIATLTIAGFGLVFSYLKRLSWSSLGFSLLITAICLQLYPLINAFWTKSRIQQNPKINDFSARNFSILLSNFDISTGANYSNTITTALKCSLSLVVAFSSILGRAGPLQCFIVALIGTVGYQLNRQIIINFANDSFGTFSIFTYEGFMGLTLGLIFRIRQKSTEGFITQRHSKYTSNISGVSQAIVGSLVIFTLLPFLALDIDSYHGISQFNVYIQPVCIVMSMGASIGASLIVTCIINGHIIIRDIIHAPIAGAIVGGSAAFFTTSVVEALIAGFIGGLVQTVIQNILEKRFALHGTIISTVSWSLFGVQGIIGGIVATVYCYLAKNSSMGFNFNPKSIDMNPGYLTLIAVISAGIGFGFGLLSGLIARISSRESFLYQFHDKQYWMNDDGISFRKSNLRETRRESIPAALRPQVKPKNPYVEESEDDILFFEEQEQHGTKNAVLVFDA